MREVCPDGNNKLEWNFFPFLKILFVFLLLGNNQPAGFLSTKTHSAVIHTQTNTVNASWPVGVGGHALGVMKMKIYLFIYFIVSQEKLFRAYVFTLQIDIKWDIPSYQSESVSSYRIYYLIICSENQVCIYLHQMINQAHRSPLCHINLVGW